MSEFLELVSSTLQSFLAAYTEDLPSEESDEAQFILALCGIVTSEFTDQLLHHIELAPMFAWFKPQVPQTPLKPPKVGIWRSDSNS